MRPLFSFALFCVLLAAPVLAQEPKPAKAKPTPEAQEAPKPKKPGLFKRVFGGKEKPAATPAPVAPPAPAAPAPRRTRPRPTPAAAAAPENKKDDDEAPAATPKPKSSSATRKSATPSPAAEPVAKTPAQLALAKAEAGGDADDIEKARYDEVRSRAIADPKVTELREQADQATGDAEGQKAAIAYNKALFSKMRSLEPKLKERIDQMEAAVLRQVAGR